MPHEPGTDLPMELVRITVIVLYFSTLGALSVYGFHKILMLAILARHRKSPGRSFPAGRAPEPLVTVQIPVYNECNVAPRIVEAVSRLDYPRDRLEIQILDDSTDETSERIEAQVARLRALGHDVHRLHRAQRTGFKAGALAEGLARARGELIAVFDADFVPPPSFLRETIPHFRDPSVGMVQARWGHLNRNHSPLTRVQALLLDGHFLIEHAARYASGRFFNFNGTAGVWRRSCIEQAGGWQQDTLTEDLDLSYRAQLAGWKFLFLPATVTPAELPVEISAFKVQQHRWAKGSMQTAKKLLPRLLASRLPWALRVEACFHLTANLGYVLMAFFSILLLPAMLLRVESRWPMALAFDLPVLLFSTVSFWLFYGAAELKAGGRLLQAARTMPMLMAVGAGLSINNARAVLEGLFGPVGTFERTPKHRIEDGAPASPSRRYRAARGSLPWLEGVFALYLTISIAIAARLALWEFLPFLLLFWAGYTYVTIASFVEAARESGLRPVE